MENNKNKKSVKFQGDMLNFCDFIQVFVPEITTLRLLMSDFRLLIYDFQLLISDFLLLVSEFLINSNFKFVKSLE